MQWKASVDGTGIIRGVQRKALWMLTNGQIDLETIHRATQPTLRAVSDAYDHRITAGEVRGDLRFLMLSHGETRS